MFYPHKKTNQFLKGIFMKKTVSTLALLSFSVFSTANAYDVVSRYKIIDDKLKTESMMRPFGHDFIFDFNVTLNKNLMDVVNDASEASKKPNSTEQLAAAQSLLYKYENTEQTIKLNFALGIPIFSFTVKDVNIKPNFRVLADVGANVGIRRETLTTQDMLDLFGEELPAEVEAIILGKAITPGSPILTAADCNVLTQPQKTACQALATQYSNVVYPDSSIPNLLFMIKGDAKVGLFNDYTYGEHFFGNWNLYGLWRVDHFQRLSKEIIATGGKVDLPAKDNMETTLQTDYKLGYKNANYTAALALEEIKIAKLTDRKEGSKEHVYGYDPLIRMHADATYKFSAFGVRPFVGMHKRSGYGFSDGLYLGSDIGAYVWGDRLGLQLKGMFDKQYFTLNPRLKLWFMQFEYSLKQPMKSKDGDVKLSAIHTVDLRFFF